MGDRRSMSAGETAEEKVKPSRRRFIELASLAAFSTTVPRSFAAAGPLSTAAFRPDLLPTADQIWGWLETMNGFGPRYTGSDAHRKFVEFLARGMQGAGLKIARDSYTFPRWQPGSWGIRATPKGGAPFDVPASFYYPQSGQTGPAGVNGPLVYAGTISSNNSHTPPVTQELKGKIVLVDYHIETRHYEEWFQPWGFYTSGTTLGPVVTSIIAVAAPLLTSYKNAGAVGAILCFTNLSDGQAFRQNLPFGRALQQIPALWVTRESGARLRKLAEGGASVTLKLEAQVFPNSTTDTLIATLPGSLSDEVLIVNTHTDGPNAVQENGGIGLLALAHYFSRLPPASRRRTLVFVLATGHYASAYVPSIRGVIEKHPDLIKKTVAAVSVEHLGCREWIDNAEMKYEPTGKDELSYAVTGSEKVSRLMLESLPGTADQRVAVVKPTPKGRYMGEAGGLVSAGVTVLNYFPGPSYLNMEAPDGCIDKLSKTHMHGQITALATLIHKMDATPSAELKG